MKHIKLIFSFILFSTIMAYSQNYTLSEIELKLINEKIKNSESKVHYQLVLIDTEIITPILSQLKTNVFAKTQELMYAFEEFEETFSYEMLSTEPRSYKELENTLQVYTTSLLENITKIGYSGEKLKYYSNIVQQIYDSYNIALIVIYNYNEIATSTNYKGYNMTNQTFLYNVKRRLSEVYNLVFTDTFAPLDKNTQENILYPIIVKHLQDNPFKIESAIYDVQNKHWEVNYTNYYSFWIEFEKNSNNINISKFTEYPYGR